jgi:PTH1 family peptidyl-tRNA hydrolase
MEYIIAGLGNPGSQYADTRHNAGRLALDVFRARHELPDFEKRGELKALLSRGIVGNAQVTLIEPDNYMNNSGTSVYKYMRSVDEPYLVVIHDDIDLPIGMFRISYNRGAGGHNGIRSIEQHTGTKKFVRIRIGIAPVSLFGGVMKKPKGERAVQQFVLKNFSFTDKKRLESVFSDVTKALDLILEDQLTKAMNTYN